MADVIMPKMGDAMDEGKIVEWLKKVGDKVSASDPIAVIETDKSNVEVEAEAAGFIQRLTHQVGDVVPVGQVIAVIGDTPPSGDGAGAAPAPSAAATPAAHTNNGVASSASVASSAPAPAPVSTPAPAPAVPATTTAAAASTAADFKPYESFVGAMPEDLGGSASVIGAPVVVGGEGSSTAASAAERVRATPLARAIAQANNVDLAAVRGTGPDGLVGKADVEAALSGAVATPAAPAPVPVAPAPQAPAAAAAPQTVAGDEVQEYNAMRRTIAKRLAESKQTIPHFYVTAEIDMEALLALREQVNAGAGENGVKISINDFLVKAVAVALTEHPVVNSQFVDNKRIVKKALNIGIGVSIPDGLIVPVIRNCEAKGLRAIARDARELIVKARSGKLTPAEYSGGTFTISNMGALTQDIDNFAAIINPGESAILSVASTRTVPAVVDGQIVPRKRMKVTLCVDHRAMDGSDGALFVATLKRVIENPLQILVA